MNEILSPSFWRGGNHIALAPGDDVPCLAEFVLAELGDGWCFFTTSGTEGARKWVGLRKESLLISARAVNAHFEVTERDHWLLALPIWHVGGFGILARAFVSEGQVTQQIGKWDAAEFVRQCHESSATICSLVPTQMFDVVAAKLTAPKSMRVVLVGGGAMSRELELAARHLGWPVCRTYGMTETASQVAAQRWEGDMEVLPIWDVSTDDDGTLTVRGTALASGYARREAGKWLWEPILPEIGLRTRDRVRLWHEGTRRFLSFVGRESGMVKILGELVALGPIQERIDALRLEMGLRDGEAVICDVPDERSEARLVLVVSGMRADEANRLLIRLNEALRPLERVSELREVSRVPRGELGKVRLEELRQGIRA